MSQIPGEGKSRYFSLNTGKGFISLWYIHSKYTERVKSLSFCPRSFDCRRLILWLWDLCKRAVGNHSSLKIQVVQYIGQGLAELFSLQLWEKKRNRVGGRDAPTLSSSSWSCLWRDMGFSSFLHPDTARKSRKVPFPFPTPFQRGRERAGVAGADSYGTWSAVSSLLQSELLLSTSKACPFPVNWM